MGCSEAGWNPLDRLSDGKKADIYSWTGLKSLKPHQIAEKNVRFHGPRLPNTHPADPTDLVIHSYKSALKFLINFGSDITRLTLVGGSFEPSEVAEICRHIGFYAENTLQEITLENSGDDLLYKMQSTLPNVRALRLNYHNFSRVDLELHRIYPALQALTLTIGEPTANAQVANQNLRIAVDSARFNAQLTALTLAMPTVSMHDLAAVAELQALQALNVQTLIRTDSQFPVHFANVRNFSGALLERAEAYFNPCPITFDRLERLHITAIVHGGHEMPFKLVEQNAQLKALTMPLIVDVSAVEQLLGRIADTHDLPALEMTWTVPACRTEALPDFGGLRRMTFEVEHCDDKRAESERIVSQLPADRWIVVSEWVQGAAGDSRQKSTIVVIEPMADFEESDDGHDDDEQTNGGGLQLPDDFPVFPAEPVEDDSSDGSSAESTKSDKTGDATDSDESDEKYVDAGDSQFPQVEGEEWDNKWAD